MQPLGGKVANILWMHCANIIHNGTAVAASAVAAAAAEDGKIFLFSFTENTQWKHSILASTASPYLHWAHNAVSGCQSYSFMQHCRMFPLRTSIRLIISKLFVGTHTHTHTLTCQYDQLDKQCNLLCIRVVIFVQWFLALWHGWGCRKEKARKRVRLEYMDGKLYT